MRASLIFVAAYVEAAVELACGAVLTHIAPTIDLNDRTQFEQARTSNSISTTADVRTGGGNTRSIVRLLRHRVVTRHVGIKVDAQRVV